jgi:hypothetical protein
MPSPISSKKQQNRHLSSQNRETPPQFESMLEWNLWFSERALRASQHSMESATRKSLWGSPETCVDSKRFLNPSTNWLRDIRASVSLFSLRRFDDLGPTPESMTLELEMPPHLHLPIEAHSQFSRQSKQECPCSCTTQHCVAMPR